MTEKNEYSGNVGQVVMGNSTGHSVHVNVGKPDEKTFITSLQRNKITMKVKELIAESGRKQLDIYGDLLTEFGADTMDVFPRQKYKDACGYLDQLIERSRPISSPPPKTCASCDSVQSAKFTNRVLVSVVLLLIVGLAWSVFWRKDQNTCEHGEARYTIGGMVENPDHSMARCSLENDSVVWQTVEPPATKKVQRLPKKHLPQNEVD